MPNITGINTPFSWLIFNHRRWLKLSILPRLNINLPINPLKVEYHPNHVYNNHPNPGMVEFYEIGLTFNLRVQPFQLDEIQP